MGVEPGVLRRRSGRETAPDPSVPAAEVGKRALAFAQVDRSATQTKKKQVIKESEKRVTRLVHHHHHSHACKLAAKEIPS